MQAHWFFSTCYVEGAHTIPVCSVYGGQWLIPSHPAAATDQVLVLMLTNPLPMAAAALDPRVLVMPYLWDPAPVPAAVTTAYAAMGATAGMSLAQLLAKLAQTEPIFAQQVLY